MLDIRMVQSVYYTNVVCLRQSMAALILNLDHHIQDIFDT